MKLYCINIMITHIKHMLTEIKDNKRACSYALGKLRGRAGQALAELAIFASIFLLALSVFVQYGLSANYSQEQNMIAFRKSLTEAFAVRERGQAGQVVILNDRAYPDARDSLGTPSYYSAYAGSSVLWSHHLLGYPTHPDVPFHVYDDGSPYRDDSPRMVIEVNGQQIIPDGKEELNTAGLGPGLVYKIFYNYNDSVSLKKPAEVTCQFPNQPDTCPDLYADTSWEWEKYDVLISKESTSLDCDAFANMLPGVNALYEVKKVVADKANAKLAGASVDIRGNKRMVTPLMIKPEHIECKQVYEGSDPYLYFWIYELYAFDPNYGDINLVYADPAQGIQPGYNKTKVSDSSFTREENYPAAPDAIRTLTDIDATETITHTVLLNSNAVGANNVIEVQSDFKTRVSQEWVTPNYYE